MYFIFILDYRNDVRQKSKFEQFSSLSSKWVVKQQRQLAFGPGTANKHTMRWWFKKSWKGEGCLEDEGHRNWPSGVENDRLRTVIKADLATTQEVTEELKSAIVQSFGI